MKLKVRRPTFENLKESLKRLDEQVAEFGLSQLQKLPKYHISIFCFHRFPFLEIVNFVRKCLRA